ncbi:Talin-2 [Liparis tanakae]|uniref:Talin-2 n=1 Tax=Liparis tanakae TaxID=230148 RepID=A0A4Z2HLX3_9TELE|nr:Talin-2 [Liparis tanakae]
MVVLSLKICIRQCNVVKTMQFEPSTAVYDACRMIRERVPEAQTGQASDYGLFLSDEDPRKGIWLESGRSLDYYMLRSGDVLEYKKKQRPQKIKMLDGAVKTVMVDDSKTVGELLVTICSRIGITNYEEYSLIQDTVEEKKEDGMGTLKKDRTLLRDERKMEKLKAKLHTDDDKIEAKVKYVKLARSLRTYGVSFFLVKEKMKSKNKLVPRLLGITKESVLRVEEKTKDVVQEWPLTTVKRWAASPKSFTLDFGEYQESYYSVQTTEGEQISQLIAGYIDIILKKKQSKDRFGLEGDEESTMLEESVSPKKSTILQQQFNRVGRVEHGSVALPGVIRSGSIGTESLSMGTMPSAQQQITMGQMHRGHMPPLVRTDRPALSAAGAAVSFTD